MIMSTLRDLEVATNRFSVTNVLGEGGYGVVYRGKLVNGTDIAVKKLLNHMYEQNYQKKLNFYCVQHNIRNLICILCLQGASGEGI